MSWRIPKDPSGRYNGDKSRCDDSDDSDDSGMDSEANNSLEQLEEFGDILRAAMSTQQEKRQRGSANWKLPLWNRNRVPEQFAPHFDGDNDEKSIATVEEFIDEEAENHANGVKTDWWWCFPAFLVSHFIIFADRSNDNSSSDSQNDVEHQPKESKSLAAAAAAEVSWEYNWKNIVWCLAVIVLLEILLVVGLLIPFLR